MSTVLVLIGVVGLCALVFRGLEIIDTVTRHAREEGDQ